MKPLKTFKNDTDFVICVYEGKNGFFVTTWDIVERKHSDKENFDTLEQAISYAKERNRQYKITESVVTESVKKVLSRLKN